MGVRAGERPRSLCLSVWCASHCATAARVGVGGAGQAPSSLLRWAVGSLQGSGPRQNSGEYLARRPPAQSVSQRASPMNPTQPHISRINSQARRARGGSAFWLAAIFSPWLAPGLFSLARAAPLGSERSSGTAVLSVVRRQKFRGGREKRIIRRMLSAGISSQPPRRPSEAGPPPLSTP